MTRSQQAEMTQAERSNRSTHALLDAAADLIVEGGFGSMTFAAIGKRAGYSRGLVTARFGSKDGLVEALIHGIVGTWSHRNVLRYTEGKSGLVGVMTILNAVRQQAARNPRDLRVLYALVFEALGPDEALRARIADLHVEMRRYFSEFVEQGLQDGSVRPGSSPEAEAALIIGALRGIGYQWLLDPKRFDPVASLNYLHDTTAARLAAPEHLDQMALVHPNDTFRNHTTVPDVPEEPRLPWRTTPELDGTF